MQCLFNSLKQDSMIEDIENIQDGSGSCMISKQGLGFYVAFNSLGHIATCQEIQETYWQYY